MTNQKDYLSILGSLRKIKPIDIIYPGIFVLFFGAILVIFFLSIQFISENINKAFSPEESAVTQALDTEKYSLVAKKLNISVGTGNNNIITATTTSISEATTTPTIIATTSVPSIITPIDKKDITILIKNSTDKKGVAGILAKALEDNGFTKPKTGDEPRRYATTTIILVESKKEYESLLLDEVRKNYPNAIATTSTSTSVADAIIIIGTK